MGEENRDELFEKLNGCQREVAELRRELNSLNGKKEAFFKNKEAVSKKIRALIGEIRSAKSSRDELTEQVKSSKQKRRELNDKMKAEIEEIKRLNQEKNALIRKHRISVDPPAIKKQIEALEYKIETEAPSFQEEKKMMKTINDLRKQYEAAKSVSGVFEKIHSVSKDIDNLRKRADETHKKVQVKAKDSQEKHEELITTSNDIDELRKKEKEEIARFAAAKKEFMAVNGRLKEKLEEMYRVKAQLGEITKVETTKKSRKEDIILREKGEEVREKIRKRQKLTTEDLLIMQGQR